MPGIELENRNRTIKIPTTKSRGHLLLLLLRGSQCVENKHINNKIKCEKCNSVLCLHSHHKGWTDWVPVCSQALHIPAPLAISKTSFSKFSPLSPISPIYASKLDRSPDRHLLRVLAFPMEKDSSQSPSRHRPRWWGLGWVYQRETRRVRYCLKEQKVSDSAKRTYSLHWGSHTFENDALNWRPIAGQSWEPWAEDGSVTWRKEPASLSHWVTTGGVSLF